MRSSSHTPGFSVLAAIGVILVIAACEPGTPPPPTSDTSDDDGTEWLSGSTSERFEAVEQQLGGFSQSMLEVGRRYEELYWAVRDGNWEYAEYQTDKIGDAIERGIVRRPGRAASAENLFLNDALAAMIEALQSREADRIRGGFEQFTQACNQCHVAEEMPFIVIGAPDSRRTPVQPEGAGR